MKSEERFYWGKSMLDIEEFNRKKQKLFETKDQINTQKELQNYLSDLKIVCTNEKSKDLVKLFQPLIDKAKKIGEEKSLFSLYWLYFRQIYYFTPTMKLTEKLIESMREISRKSNDIEQKAIVLASESLFHQFRGKNEKSIMLMSKALKFLKSSEEIYPDTYYTVLFSHTLFSSFKNQNYSKVIQKMEKCLSYYHRSYNTLGMIRTIAHLLRFYTFSNLDDKYEKLIRWIFSNEKIPEKILDSHYVMLFTNLGKFSTIRDEIDTAIAFMSKAYDKMKTKKFQLDNIYDYTDILRILSRCYAYKGNFEEAYNLLVELISFIEHDLVKKDSLEKLVKVVYFSTYYTLLFIYVQLDIDIASLRNDKLKHVYEYTKSLIMETKVSENFLLDVSMDEVQKEELLKNGKSQSKHEIYLSLHQLLLTHTPYATDKKTTDTITLIKDYTYTPLFADVLLGKIHLSKGNYNEFYKIVKRLKTKKNSAKTPILKIWIEFLILIEQYLINPKDVNIPRKLNELEELCRNNNFKKMSEEIKLYIRLITSSKTFKSSKDRFKQTAFMDVFSDQQKEMVMRILEN